MGSVAIFCAYFVNAFAKLIQNNNGVVSLAAMNLPADWKEHLSVQMQWNCIK